MGGTPSVWSSDKDTSVAQSSTERDWVTPELGLGGGGRGQQEEHFRKEGQLAPAAVLMPLVAGRYWGRSLVWTLDFPVLLSKDVVGISKRTCDLLCLTRCMSVVPRVTVPAKGKNTEGGRRRPVETLRRQSPAPR